MSSSPSSSSSSSSSSNANDVLLSEFNIRFSPDRIKTVMQAALDAGFAIMQDVTPVKTGFLKSSEGVSVTASSSSSSSDGIEGEMHADAEYAGYVNYGTSRQRAQPFFDRGTATAYQKLKDGCSTL